jgi:exodeoxyribonuclease VII large subunit
LNVLRRGYSLTRTENGTLVRDAAQVHPGDKLLTRVAAGEITSRVELCTPNPPETETEHSAE